MFRRILLTVLLLPLYYFLWSQTTLNFEIANAANDSCLIAYYYGDKQYILGDNGVNQVMYLDAKGKGTFVRDDMEEGIYMVVFPPKNDYVEFLFESRDATIRFDRNDPVRTLEAINSPGSSLLFEYQRHIAALNAVYPGAGEDEVQGRQLQAAITTFRDSILTEFPLNMFVKLLRMTLDPVIPEAVSEKGDNEVYLYYKARYLNNIPFGESWILRTPIYHFKLMTYLEKLTVQHPDSIKVSIDRILGLAEKDPDVYQYSLVTLFNKYAESKIMGHDALYVHMAKKYYFNGKAPWIDDEQLDKIRDRVRALENNLIGLKSKDIRYTVPGGEVRWLHGQEAAYTILIFSESDCGYCQSMVNDLKRLRNSIPVGTRVIVLQLDSSSEEMLPPDNENYWQSGVLSASEGELVRRNYDVRSTPKLFLLDKEKVIIGKQLGVEQAIGLIGSMEESD